VLRKNRIFLFFPRYTLTVCGRFLRPSEGKAALDTGLLREEKRRRGEPTTRWSTRLWQASHARSVLCASVRACSTHSALILGDFCASVCALVLLARQNISASASRWPCIRSVMPSHGALRTRPVCPLFGSPHGLPGDQLGRWGNRRRAHGGSARGVAYAGAAQRALDAPRSRESCTGSSRRWRATIFRGVSDASPTYCGANSACASRRARCARTGPRVYSLDQASACRRNAGVPLDVITRVPASSMTRP
jgi:hypothetical protein